MGQKATIYYDYNIGQPVAVSDLNNPPNYTFYAYNSDAQPGSGYDALDRLVRVTLPNNGTISYSYPNSTTIVTKQDQNSPGDGALQSQQLYDGFGRLSETDTFEPGGKYIASTQGYDALGRTASITNPSESGDGLNYSTTYTYDGLGRVTRLQAQDGSATTTDYLSGNNNSAMVTDPQGVQRRNWTDGLGNLIEVDEDPNGPLAYTTRYSYSPLGQLTAVMQGQQTRTFNYDSLGRLLSATNPESGTTNYSYDSANNLLLKTDARGVMTCFGTISNGQCGGTGYDALNRPALKTYSDGTPSVSYSYDAPGVANSAGHLTQVSNGVATINYSAFDKLGNVTGSSAAIGGTPYSFAYTYNLAGELTQETYPSGRQIIWTKARA